MLNYTPKDFLKAETSEIHASNGCALELVFLNKADKAVCNGRLSVDILLSFDSSYIFI